MDESSFEVMVVDEQELHLPIQDIDEDKIDPDNDNARLRHHLWNGKGPEDYIREMRDTPELRESIRSNGGLLEKIFVQPTGNGRYRAREGNRRLVCIRDLRHQFPDDPRWRKVPARILPADLEPKKLAILLADWHVKGKVKWDAHEKAGQIYYMNTNIKMSVGEIAKILRASKTTVERWLKAYRFMFERYSILDGGKYAKDRDGKWSFFDELYRSKELKQRADEDPEFADKFCHWVGEGRLPKGDTVRRLGAIIKNPEAFRAFEMQPAANGKAYSEAMRIVERADPEQGSEFFKLLAEVRKQCRDIASVREIMRIRTDKVAEELFRDTVDAMVSFGRLAEVDSMSGK